MTPLQLPQAAAAEDAVLTQLALEPDWADHHATWQAAYDAYRAGSGDPWQVNPAIFSTDQNIADQISARQRKLYKSRGKSGIIRQIRRTPGLLSCPMCGSRHTGTLDHYLPKDDFAEFAILPANLLPACSHCNSGVKGGLFRGDVAPERFIHPYYDEIADQPIWHVALVPPFEAARFEACAGDMVDPADVAMVQFHLDHILGEVFQNDVSTQWSKLPEVLRVEHDSAEPLTEAEGERLLVKRLRSTIVTDGQNSWDSALLRGVLRDPAAITFLVDRQNALP